MTKLTSTATFKLLCLLFICTGLFSISVRAEEVDFSCIKQDVRAKTQVTERYREFDVILVNQCPGAVYWSMCVERMDPWTSENMETLTPSGHIVAEQKFRLNLQMMRRQEAGSDRSAFEEFYVNLAFDINSVKRAECVATSCEREKQSLRNQLRSNDKSRQQAEQQVAKKLAADCPKSGWGDTDQVECESKVRKAGQPELDSIAQKEAELLAQLAEVNPGKCETY